VSNDEEFTGHEVLLKGTFKCSPLVRKGAKILITAGRECKRSALFVGFFMEHTAGSAVFF
jgi:hypothetical protein